MSATLDPYYSDESVTLHLGKCATVLPLLPANSVDAIVTDPPAAVVVHGPRVGIRGPGRPG